MSTKEGETRYINKSGIPLPKQRFKNLNTLQNALGSVGGSSSPPILSDSCYVKSMEEQWKPDILGFGVV